MRNRIGDIYIVKGLWEGTVIIKIIRKDIWKDNKIYWHWICLYDDANNDIFRHSINKDVGYNWLEESFNTSYKDKITLADTKMKKKLLAELL